MVNVLTAAQDEFSRKRKVYRLSQGGNLMTTLQTRVDDQFDALTPEAGQKETRKALLTANPAVQWLVEAYKGAMRNTYEHTGITQIEGILNMCPFPFRKEDVEQLPFYIGNCRKQGFVNRVTPYFDEDTRSLGLFLSGCAYRCRWTEKTLTVQGTELDSIGYCMHSGTIRIQGSATNPGSSMKSGHIYIEGDSENAGRDMSGGLIEVYGNETEAGWGMTDGKLYIHGNAETVGSFMEGGAIRVDGSVSRTIGDGMTGGTIRVNGRRPKIAKSIKGGTIYHRDRVIYSEGEKK